MLAGGPECALATLAESARRFANLPGKEGVDGRFAVRNVALDLSRESELPPAVRWQILRAAATTANPERTGAVDDLRYDTILLVHGAKALADDHAFSESWAAWLVAIGLDQRLPADSRVLRELYIFEPFPHAPGDQGYLEIALLIAAATQGDASLTGVRYDIARALHFKGPNWRFTGDREYAIARAKLAVVLADRLADVDLCGRECAGEWRWQPLLNAGLALHRAGSPDGGAVVARAIEISRQAHNLDERRGLHGRILAELVYSRYERKVVEDYFAESRALADSDDTPHARDLRRALPRLLEIWRSYPVR